MRSQRDSKRLTVYQRFENLIAMALSLIISLVIVVALCRLVIAIVNGLVQGALNPLEPKFPWLRV